MKRVGLVEFGTPVVCRPLIIFSVDIVETLHGGEGGDVERWLEPQNKSFVFAIDFHFPSLLLYISFLCYILCALHYCIHFIPCIFGLYSSQQESNYAPQLII